MHLIFLSICSQYQGCHGQGKNTWKMKIFPGQGKVREFCGWPGKFRKDLESQGKVREFENKWLWQAAFRNFFFILFKRGKDVLSHEMVAAHLPPHWGLLLKERICSLGELVLSFKSSPQI